MRSYIVFFNHYFFSHSSSEDESSDESDSDVPRKSRKVQKKKVEKRQTRTVVNYKIPESDDDEEEESEEDEEDVLMEYVEEDTRQSSIIIDTGTSDQIEKVLKHRDGAPGATGPQTTWYNIQSNGDPNEKASGIIFLIPFFKI